ncbi:MAG: hypothetical protein KF782_12875 [Labilithrix sp.]|nr:hypothetical protein [Labilithrix sp.]
MRSSLHSFAPRLPFLGLAPLALVSALTNVTAVSRGDGSPTGGGEHRRVDRRRRRGHGVRERGHRIAIVVTGLPGIDAKITLHHAVGRGGRGDRGATLADQPAGVRGERGARGM